MNTCRDEGTNPNKLFGFERGESYFARAKQWEQIGARFLDKCTHLWHASCDQMVLPDDSTHRLLEEISKRIDDLREDIHDFKSEARDEFKDIRATLRVHQEKLDKIYDARHALKVTWGWQWGAISLLIAIAASGATAVIAFIVQPT